MHDETKELAIDVLDQLAALVRKERETLLAEWRQQVRQLPSAANLDILTLNDHIPRLIDEIITALGNKSAQSIPDALEEGSPLIHGLQRLQENFEIEEVVAEYNILRGCLHDLADKHGLNLQGRPFHIINRVLDQAIGGALQTYSTQQALEVQQRREEYLAFVAHDLRTPLNAISLAGTVLELTLSPQDNRPEIMQMLKALSRSVQQLKSLVDRVIEENAHLPTDSGIKLERREFDLWPLVEALIFDLNPVAETAGTKLVNQIPFDLMIYADANLLRRVLQNLIANAIKYTPHGTICISACERAADGMVECSVSDDGSGISAASLTKIFEKGETDQENPGGTGLGLAIVKTFVEAHNGQVSVESKKDAGSTFRFSLPVRTKERAEVLASK